MLKPDWTLGAVAFIGVAFAAGPLAAECRWIVRPYVSEVLTGRPAFDIVYDGLERRTFYAFSVASKEIAEQIEEGRAPLELGRDLRPLEALQTPLDHTVYRLDPASQPADTVYLVAAAEPVASLEEAGAEFVPARPTMVSQYVPRTRGATAHSGPLPGRTDPTTVAEASGIRAGDALTICAYEVPLG